MAGHEQFVKDEKAIQQAGDINALQKAADTAAHDGLFLDIIKDMQSKKLATRDFVDTKGNPANDQLAHGFITFAGGTQEAYWTYDKANKEVGVGQPCQE